jgi:DNA-directed RNA polymerase subunit beta'
VALEDGNFVVLNKNGSVSIISDEGEELETHQMTTGAVLFVKDGEKFRGYTVDEKTKEKIEGQLIAAWDPYSVPIISEKGGQVKFIDIIEEATVKYEVDPVSGKEAMVIIEHKEDLHPRIAIFSADGKELESYPISAGAYLMVNDGDYLSAGTIIAKTPRQTLKTKDITGGLPRVAELFEARRPKDAAEISKIDGRVEFGSIIRGKRKIIIRDERTGITEEHELPVSKHVIPFNGDFVKKGDQLCEGPIDPHEILEVCGPQELQEYLVNEVQEVYRLQGVTINDKHVEIIVRKMLRKVRIVEPGDTQFLWGEQVDKIDFETENQRVFKMGGKPAEAQPVLLGITKASLETDSFLSAASFQDTTRILTESATLSRVDYLRGFKENVIIGHIIPAGTGFNKHRKIYVKPLVETGFQQEEQQAAISAIGS